MSSRWEYLDDLLKDCAELARKTGVPPESESLIVAALILSDSLNGLRKALLQKASTKRNDY